MSSIGCTNIPFLSERGLIYAVLSLRAGYRQNLSAKKEVIAG